MHPKPLLALLALAAVAAQSPAQTSRAFRSQPIRAGVLTLRNPSGGYELPSAAPFAFYNLENALSVKPAEWTFVNPNNEGTLSQATASRWATFDPAAVARVPVGGRVQKRYAPYWEVSLASASDADLAGYDVLLLAPVGNVQLNPLERERLQRFVDGGGVLWLDVDPSLTTFDAANGFPLPFFVVAGSGGNGTDFFSPLLSSPLPLSVNDVARLSDGGATSGPTMVPVPTGSGVDPLLSSVVGLRSFGRLSAVTTRGGAPTIATGRIGDGYMVTTTTRTAQKLNRTRTDAGYQANIQFLASDPKLTQEGVSAAKFATNLVSLVSSANQFGGAGRHQFSSGIDIGAPLLGRFRATYPDAYTAAPANLRPPVVYKGLIFVAEDDRVLCYDADPNRDADGDGDPDDGLRDLAGGAARDLVFRTVAIPGGISSVTATEVSDPAPGGPRDMLLVTGGDGTVHLFEVYGPVVSGRRQWPTAAGAQLPQLYQIAPPSAANGSVGNGTVFPPTVHDGIAFVVDTVAGGGVGGGNVGRLRAIDLRTGTALTTPAGATPFVAGGTAAPIPEPTGPATVGQIPILDNSGGSDIVAYVPVKGQSGGGNQTGPGIVSYWFGVKGEKPFEIQASGSVLTLTTRAATQGGLPIYLTSGGASSPLGLKVTVLKKDGTPYTQAEMANVFTGTVNETQGQLQIGLKAGVSWPPTDVDPENPIRVDYTIDWAKAGPGAIASIERGRILFNDPTNGGRRILGGVALGPQGTIFANVSSQDLPGPGARYGGTVYALKEEGRGSFRMAWRWDLYPRHTLSYEGGSTTYESVLPDNDPVQNLKFGGFSLATVLGGRFTNASLQGPPVVRGDKVFVSVSGAKVAGSSASAILCFAAEPPAPEFRTDLDLSGGGGFAVVQPDFARSSDPTNPRVFSVLTSAAGGNGQDGVSFQKSATGVGGTVRFASLASARNGQVVDSISLSQPILLRRPGQSDLLLEPSTQGRWSPLQWYTILHGTTLYGPTFASGNTLYASGMSVLPSFLAGTFPPTPKQEGFLTALRTDVDITNAEPTTQAFTTNPNGFSPKSVVLDAGRPWLRQLNSLDYPRANLSYTSEQAANDRIYSTPYFVIPQNPRNAEERGRTSFDDYKVRLLQAVLPNSVQPFGTTTPSSYGVVGGDRTLVAWNAQGIYGFTRSDFWVADEGRIARIDPSGNVLFDSRASFRLGDSGGSAAGTVVPLVRPTRVVTVQGDDDLLVVDSGANKILRTDPSGVVSREISGISIDPNFAPNGYRNNEPLTFKNPRDVATFVTRVAAADNPFSTPAAIEEWTHYLVADEGNARLVELVDRVEIDANGNRVGYVGGEDKLGTLLWHSPAGVSGKGFDYNSVTRVALDGKDANGNAIKRYAFVAGIGSVAPGRQDAGEVPPSDAAGGAAAGPADGRDAGGGGGVVVFDPTLPAGLEVYNSVETPPIPGTVRPLFGGDRGVDPTAFAIGQGAFRTAADDVPAGTVAGGNAHRFAGVSSVTASTVTDASGNAQIAVMVTDRTGVYEAVPVAAPVAASAGVPEDKYRKVLRTRWMLTDEAFRAMRRTQTGGAASGTFVVSSDAPSALRATYARRLDDENVILVNGYLGTTFGRYDAGVGAVVGRDRFDGEVLQIDGRLDPAVQPRGTIGNGYNVQNDNLGFELRSIRVRFGTTEGARGILQPVFADRR